MSQLRRFVARVICLAALCASLSGCGSSRGGESATLRATYGSFPDYLDPQLSYSVEGWTAMYNTYIPLLTYAHAGGDAGSEVIPGLAKSLPKIDDRGRTYTLFLRKGLKYSDGTPVRASDFKFAVERMFRLNSAGSPLYTDIVGAERFQKTKRGRIDGIETDDKTGEIVIHLTRPRGTFTNELALLLVAPVPRDTPIEDQSPNPPPATGPYAIVKSEPGRSWAYERNPEWGTNNGKLMPQLPDGHVDRIEIDVIRNSSTQVNYIEQGQYDWMQNAPPSGRYAEVRSRYEGSQFRVEPTISVYYFWMNVTKPPFDDVRVRRAVNYAIDPAALKRIYAGQIEPTQQILPPGMPGYRKFELYPHSMAKAKRLIEDADPADRDITVWTESENPSDEAAEYYADVLSKLGFHTTLKKLGSDNYFTVIGNASTPDLDTGWGNWFEDYPHPNDFFQPMLSGESIGYTNLSQFDEPALDAKIRQLAERPLDRAEEERYAELDREIMEQAPLAPYGNRTFPTFVSGEVDLDKVIVNPTFGPDLTSFQFK